ncbi:outer membrane protein TolC [Desulfosoma caldarium]|uniref:Outer membrane protein TolC n=2 Tax=Desulfosoma caldarium TaxID=610254 RepID=A0A3N1UN58_9BACT|nr:outer membrane protein TolC [Desulfosoma caldarium]
MMSLSGDGVLVALSARDEASPKGWGKVTQWGLWWGFCLLWLGSFAALAFAADTAPDEVLSVQAAVDEALANHHLIREAEELEKAAMNEEKSAQAALKPSLTAHYQYIRLEDHPYAVFRTNLGVQQVEMGHRSTYTWNVTLTQPLFTGFALSTKKKIAALDVAVSQVRREAAILDVIKYVKTAYYRVLLAQRQLDVAREAQEQLRAHLLDAQRFYEQGLIPYNDVLKSQVALAQAQQVHVRRQKDLELASADLNRLLGRDLARPVRLEEAEPFVPQALSLDDLMAEALRARPELAILRLEVGKAKEAVRLAASDFYPKVFAVGLYERTGKDPLGEENDYRNPDTAAVGVRMDWSIFEWGRTQSQVRRQRHRFKALEERLAEIESSVLLEVKAALADVQVAEENILTAKKALEQAKENLRITRLQYQQQVTTVTEVLDARTYLTQAESNFYAAHYGRHIAVAELARAVGRRDLNKGDLHGR